MWRGGRRHISDALRRVLSSSVMGQVQFAARFLAECMQSHHENKSPAIFLVKL